MTQIAHSRLGANIIARELYCPESLMFGSGDIEHALTNKVTHTSNGAKSIYGQQIDSEIKRRLSNVYRHKEPYNYYDVLSEKELDNICLNILYMFENYEVIMDNNYSLTTLFSYILDAKMTKTDFSIYGLDKLENIDVARFDNTDISKEFTFTVQPDFVGYNKENNRIKILDIKTGGSSDNIEDCNINYEIQLKTIALAVYLKNNIDYNRNIQVFECVIYNVETDKVQTYKYSIYDLQNFLNQQIVPLLEKISKLEPYKDYIDIFEKRKPNKCCVNCGNKYCPHSMYGRKVS